MILQIVGCSHHRSSVEIRERLAFSPKQTSSFLQKFQQNYPQSEVVLLSTCNRTELYTAGHSLELVPSPQEMSMFLAESCGIQHADIHDFLFERLAMVRIDSPSEPRHV